MSGIEPPSIPPQAAFTTVCRGVFAWVFRGRPDSRARDGGPVLANPPGTPGPTSKEPPMATFDELKAKYAPALRDAGAWHAQGRGHTVSG